LRQVNLEAESECESLYALILYMPPTFKCYSMTSTPKLGLTQTILESIAIIVIKLLMIYQRAVLIVIKIHRPTALVLTLLLQVILTARRNTCVQCATHTHSAVQELLSVRHTCRLYRNA